jgi:hypothetical protein
MALDPIVSKDSIKAELNQAWGGWLTELGDKNGGWDWWVTATFRDPELEAQKRGWTKIGWGYSGRAWDKFMLELGLQKGLHDLWWVRGREIQKGRGVPHFHGLVGGVAGLRYVEAQNWWWGKFGIAKIEPYDRSLGAGYYLCKYVTKELGEIEFSKGLQGRS